MFFLQRTRRNSRKLKVVGVSILFVSASKAKQSPTAFVADKPRLPTYAFSFGVACFVGLRPSLNDGVFGMSAIGLGLVQTFSEHFVLRQTQEDTMWIS